MISTLPRSVAVSVVICAHNPDPGRLRTTLLGLRGQSLPVSTWETIIVNNASSRWPDAEFWAEFASPGLTLVEEPRPGLSFARRRGLGLAGGEIFVLVDDDNVLAPDYLARTIQIFADDPHLGAIGGRSLPEFEVPPPPWLREFYPLLALRDLPGPARVATTLLPNGAFRPEYPGAAAPIGAGMALRRDAAHAWLATPIPMDLPDRRGEELTSGGDNDIVFTVLEHGWHVGSFPELTLTHLIPAARLAPDYLARLNRGIQRSWMHVLDQHHANPWEPIEAWTIPLRTAKAWLAFRAWRGPAEYIRWQGACGHFDGRRIPDPTP